MSPYDPQRGRARPEPTDDQPAPVDALLEPGPPSTELPDGVELEITEGGDTVVHTLGADVEVTPLGDDVVVHTADADVEVRSDTDEVVVTAAGEEIYVDTSPRSGAEEAASFAGPPSPSGRSRLVMAVVAALATILLVLLWNRRRR